MTELSWHLIHGAQTKEGPFNTHFSVYHKKSISFIKGKQKKEEISFYTLNVFYSLTRNYLSFFFFFFSFCVLSFLVRRCLSNIALYSRRICSKPFNVRGSEFCRKYRMIVFVFQIPILCILTPVL